VVDDDLVGALAELVVGSPEDHGWSRPTWTRELLVEALERVTGVGVSVSTLARMLRSLGAHWGTARPFVLCPWPAEQRERRLSAIRRLISRLPSDEVALDEDEVDIHLNPKIGRDWMMRGKQKMVLTPGRNKKRYVAGALSVSGDELVWVEHESKTTDLFLMLLNCLLRTYPKARRIHLILDNYGIHSSHKANCYLAHCGQRIRLHFLPPYCPQHNPIERVWGDLHAQVTRNHRCRSMPTLMLRVRAYLNRRAA